MIPLKASRLQVETWQKTLSTAVTKVEVLLRRLELSNADVETDPAFGLLVPEPFLNRMQRGNPLDPLLLQVLPRLHESDALLPGYKMDALDEANSSPLTGVIHKYQGRVLIMASGQCGVNCRYCFRRHFPYGEHLLDKKGWQRAIEFVAADQTITEVILSGGDPLVMNDHQLAAITTKLSAISHIKRIRLHTRLPIVIPERVCDTLMAWIESNRLPIVMVIHCNHANEIDHSVQRAMARLRAAGVTLLNQSVLLKGINDDASTLTNLSEALFEIGVLPYYLHMPDPVAGTAHFSVSEERAITLSRAITAKLPGYLVPKLVKEIPGESAKSLIM